MKKAKLIIDGKEIEIIIPQEQLDKLFPPKKKTGYERVDDEEHYYYIHHDGKIELALENGVYSDEVAYDNANYYSDKTVAENNARADRLMRQLRRFAVEHREEEIDWRNSDQTRFYIYNSVKNGLTISGVNFIREFGAIYFDSRETAQLAIDAFKDELLWYFTEYKDSL